MGPKPFSSGSSTEFSFDKVFSVPQVPGIEPPEKREEIIDNKPDLIPTERPPYFDEPSPVVEEIEVQQQQPEVVIRKDASPIEEEPVDEENVELRQKTDDEVFKRPTTAERRKVGSERE